MKMARRLKTTTARGGGASLLHILYGALIATIVLFAVYTLFRKERFKVETDSKMDEYIRRLKEILIDVGELGNDLDVRAGSESATFEKKTIYICLKNPKTGDFYGMDVLTYVAVHELAHVLSTSFSSVVHNDEFKQNFNRLLKRAVDKGYLTARVQIPADYCGLKS